MAFPKGQKQSKEHSQKISRALHGLKRSEDFKEKIRRARLGKKLTDTTIEKIKANRAGKGIGNTNGLGKNLGNQNAKGKTLGSRNVNWKGGITPKYRIRTAPRPKPDICECCGDTGRIVLDHNHSTGQFRGWLCSRCNVALGMARDNKDILLALAAYLANGL